MSAGRQRIHSSSSRSSSSSFMAQCVNPYNGDELFRPYRFASPYAGIVIRCTAGINRYFQITINSEYHSDVQIQSICEFIQETLSDDRCVQDPTFLDPVRLQIATMLKRPSKIVPSGLGTCTQHSPPGSMCVGAQPAHIHRLNTSLQILVSMQSSTSLRPAKSTTQNDIARMQQRYQKWHNLPRWEAPQHVVPQFADRRDCLACTMQMKIHQKASNDTRCEVGLRRQLFADNVCIHSVRNVKRALGTPISPAPEGVIRRDQAPPLWH